MSNKPPFDLGPLPQSSRTHELEALSVQAFRAIMPSDKFIVRDVRESDYGVDLHIEAKNNKQPTNFIAHVQLKSTDSSEKNSDESISLQVKSANLNYLLNGPLGIYVLYVAPTKQFRYVWALSEYKRLERDSPEWRKQDTVTLRFVHVLDASAIEEIHERIIEKSHFHRGLTDVLAQKERHAEAGKTEIPRVTIDTGNLAITDATVTLQRLISEGINLVATGRAALVLELSHTIPYKDAKDSRVQLAMAYAHYSLGQFIQCDAHLMNSSLSKEVLNQHEQYLLSTLQSACLFHAGTMSMQDFLKQEQEAITRLSDPRLQLQAELYYARIESLSLFKQPSSEVFQKLHQACEQLVKKASLQKDLTVHFQAVIALLEIEGNKRLYDYVSAVTEAEAKVMMGLVDPRVREQYGKVLNAEFQQLKKRIDALVQPVKNVDARLLFSDLVLTGGKLLFGFLFHSKYLSMGLSHNIIIEAALIETEVQQLREAAESFHTNDMKYDEVKARSLVADFLYFIGKTEPAKEIARHTLPLATAMRYHPLATHLQQIIDEKTAIEEFATSLADFERVGAKEDEDYVLTGCNDAQLKDFANLVMKTNGIPVSAQNDIYAQFFTRRMLAQEHFNWCQHLELDPDPNGMWRCFCPKTRLSTRYLAPQAEATVAAFKTACCSTCTMRQPKKQLERR